MITTAIKQLPLSGGYLIKDCDSQFVQLYAAGINYFLTKAKHPVKITLLNPSERMIEIFKGYPHLQLRWCREENMAHFKTIIDEQYVWKHSKIC